MRLTHDVDVPGELIAAQQEGRLVVFAGAGVSMGPPSNLPSFKDLSASVAHPPLDPPGDEPLDRYLGRAEALGVDVQTRTRALIDRPGSRPTPLHEHLVDLFGRKSPLRIVTTNFDRHFTTVATARFGADIDIYYAPALPRGGDFEGLVYLHGAVERARSQLVLTDRDFGRAYITEGWAARMLTEMFAAYTVLFVGYSHSDPVVSYLARGLVPGTVRYALTDNAGAGWDILGIIPVVSPLRPDPDRYGAVRDVLAAWADESRRGVLDHENRIRTLLQSAPPVDPTDRDYLVAALQDPVKLRFFTDHAGDEAWLVWVEEHEGLLPLFDAAALDPTRAEILSGWLARRYALDQPGSALSVVLRGGPGRVHPALVLAVARELSLRDPVPEARVIARWTAVLLEAAADRSGYLALEILLRTCTRPGDRTTALLLFGQLTRPVLVPEAGLRAGDAADPTRLPYSVAFAGQPHTMARAWTEIIRPGLPTDLVRIAATVSEHLAEANRLLIAAGVATGDWDPVSFRRRAIEPHFQDRFPGAIDVLIDVARDLIEAAWVSDARTAEALIRLWADARTPLLRRLAIHGRASDPGLEGDQAIVWVLDRSWLFDPTLKHEVFRLLALAYPLASAESRTVLLAAVRDVEIRAYDGAELPPDMVRRARYDLAEWIRRHAADTAEIDTLLDELSHNEPAMQPREHPDLAFWVGPVEWITPESPISPENLLEKPPRAWTEGQLAAVWENADYDKREGLERALQTAASQNADWAIELARDFSAMVGSPAWIWNSLAAGWRDAQLDEARWAQVVELVRADHVLTAAGAAVADLLAVGLESVGIPWNMVDEVERIADRLLALHADDPQVAAPDAHGGWLFVAINHTGGKAAQVWLRALARRSSESQSRMAAVTEEHRARAALLSAAATPGEQAARVVIASQLGFYYTLDPEWTAATLLPWFDWDRDPVRAEQAWHGYLFWGRLIDPLIAQMVPYLVQSFSRLRRELASVAEPFTSRLALIALQSSVNPVASGWLDRFLMDAEAESRVAWLRALRQHLEGLSAEGTRSAWNDWLRSFWERRLEGIPVPFSDRERGEIPDLALALEAVFPDAVSLATRTPPALAEHAMVFFALRESALPDSYPNEVADLLTHILSGVPQLPYDADYVAAVAERVCTAGAEPQLLLGLLERMAQHGISTAGACIERVRREAGG